MSHPHHTDVLGKFAVDVGEEVAHMIKNYGGGACFLLAVLDQGSDRSIEVAVASDMSPESALYAVDMIRKRLLALTERPEHKPS